MPGTNGSGRLDRIEANLEGATERLNALTERMNEMAEEHDAEFKRLMTWQVLMQDEVRKLAADEAAYRQEQRRRDREADERIGKLVSAIGAFVQRLPAPTGDV